LIPVAVTQTLKKLTTLRTKIASSVVNCHNLGAKLVTYQWNLPYSSSEIIRRLELLDEDDVVGSGGFGTVYKMVMDDGTAFAVKRIDLQRESRDRTFEKELEILGSIRHINLVNLRGYCRLPTAKLLIYDFVELGSLDCYLHGKQTSTSTIVTIFNTRCVAYVMCC
jgi:hypothetical protein